MIRWNLVDVGLDNFFNLNEFLCRFTGVNIAGNAYDTMLYNILNIAGQWKPILPDAKCSNDVMLIQASFRAW